VPRAHPVQEGTYFLGREIDLVGFVGGGLQIFDQLIFFLDDLVLWRKILAGIDSKASLWEIDNVAHRGAHLKIPA